MPNPFVEAGMIPGPRPTITERVQETVGSATREAKEEIIDEVRNSGMGSSFSTGPSWSHKGKRFAQDIGAMGLEFVKRAIQLAIAKFVLELCAMIIDAIMRAITKSGASKMDITSPNVMYSTNGQTAAPAQPTSSWLSRSSSNAGPRTDFSSSTAVGW